MSATGRRYTDVLSSLLVMLSVGGTNQLHRVLLSGLAAEWMALTFAYDLTSELAELTDFPVLQGSCFASSLLQLLWILAFQRLQEVLPLD